ncbi:hypothetical protein HGO53_01730 [Wolbachia endosymbiont of Diaphorina citri]|jgi:hypothetical protein|uniref:hypothetical protein n=1 Tax=Wolbachia endosymbiont of Diaphorina citri TaxID=116598 RepID=UPI000309C6F8|nr:hypothetical protein [Wolbachia endosymbiont of Diaphorina citri]QJT94068.1 hypothetical protein HGO48_01020 [Wolbachia endosymbiont of Diaphorina citri]QJT95309.1 hypothetical protein HGO49_01020 [Wolbachia endosymbiont of Diaphorina citri]QJT96671.1 hypothetical protein HGO53_01730 [Wolbachia endosymbiont of Diaphorina citri]QLK10967.1 hypothetical protein FK497_01060 [Wolbachia endosymbiont of Diaphorina citri]QXY87500.1 hypothetical protein GZ064_06735 [Wolbachia endosymbiont of Diaphor
MSKKIVNALKSEVKKLKYSDLKSIPMKSGGWSSINSGYNTYIDLGRSHNLTINEKEVPNELIEKLYSKHKDLILEDENGRKNYSPSLKQIFIKIFEHAGAVVPSDSIIEELITNYHQEGYNHFLFLHILKALSPFGLLVLDSNVIITYSMYCRDSNCLKLNFSMDCIKVCSSDLVNDIKTPGFYSSVEFKLKSKGRSITYEDGKVLITIPKELKNHKASGRNFFDIATERFQEFCENLGFNFETKVEHSIDKPLTVLKDANTSHDKNLSLNQQLSNSR